MKDYRCNVIRDTTGLRMSMEELDDLAVYINGRFNGGVGPQQVYDALCHRYPMFLTPGSPRESRYALQGWRDAIWCGSSDLQRSHWHRLADTIDRLMYLLLLMEGKIR